MIGSEKADLIFFNDFRYESPNEIFEWGDMLNMLDGSAFRISTPKSQHAQDLVWSKKQPIFATGPKKIQRFHKGSQHNLNIIETAQMDARWKYIELKHQIEDINMPCARCFAELALTEE